MRRATSPEQQPARRATPPELPKLTHAIIYSALAEEVGVCTTKRNRSNDFKQVVLGNVNKFINEKTQDLRRKKTTCQGVLAVETEEQVVEETEMAL